MLYVIIVYTLKYFKNHQRTFFGEHAKGSYIRGTVVCISSPGIYTCGESAWRAVRARRVQVACQEAELALFMACPLLSETHAYPPFAHISVYCYFYDA